MCSKKREESQIVKYGVSNAGGTPESLEKCKITCLKKYNQTSASKCDAIKQKTKETCLKKYGKTSFLSTKSCRDSLRSFCIEKYGVENISRSETVKEKIKETCLKKYGVDHPRKNKENMDKFNELFFQKHGVKFPSQMIDHLYKRKNTCLKIYGHDHPVKNKNIQNKIRETCLEKYGKYPVNCFGKTEKEIADFVRSLEIDCRSDRILLEGKEIDIYAEEKNIAIEYCGLFWHNEFSPCPRNKKYHYEKYKSLKEKNIKLLTIFEDEWENKKEICKSIISSCFGKFEKRIYARNTKIKKLDKKITKKFLEENHLNGSTEFLFSYGLYNDDQLVALFTYGKHHRKSNEYVLSRFCTLKNTQVIGGISKLFKHLRKIIKKGEKIVTWSDNRWSNGDIYKILGFTNDCQLPPDYSYYKYGSNCVRKSKQSMKKSNIGCPKELTERDWCIEMGYVRIWDCGKIRWIFQNN